MPTPYDTAMDALRDEMAKHHDSPGIAYIGECMTGRLQADHTLADRLTATGKTLAGAFESIRSYASKHKTGNYAFVPPEKGVAIACEYYGIPADGAAAPQAQTPAPADDGLDLDALLGG